MAKTKTPEAPPYQGDQGDEQAAVPVAPLDEEVELLHPDVDYTPPSPTGHPTVDALNEQIAANHVELAGSPPQEPGAEVGDHVYYLTTQGQLRAIVTRIDPQPTGAPQRVSLTLFGHREVQYRDEVPYGHTPGCWCTSGEWRVVSG